MDNRARGIIVDATIISSYMYTIIDHMISVILDKGQRLAHYMWIVQCSTAWWLYWRSVKPLS